MTKIYVCTDNDLKASIRRLFNNGELTLDQYAQCLRRWQSLGIKPIDTHKSDDTLQKYGLRGFPNPLQDSRDYHTSFSSKPLFFICKELGIQVL